MVKNNDGKEMYASKEALSAAVKEACYGLEGLEIFWQDYQTFAQVAIVEGKGKTVMASSNIVKLLSIGGQFWNVRYTKKEGLVALFTFKKTPEAAQEAKAKLAEVEKVVTAQGGKGKDARHSTAQPSTPQHPSPRKGGNMATANKGVNGSIDECGRAGNSPFYGYIASEEAAYNEWEARCKARKAAKEGAQAQLLTAMRAPLNAPVDDATQAGAEIASKAIGDKVQARIRAKVAQKPAPAQEAPAVQIVQPDISEKYPQLKGALLVRLTADANEFSVKGKVGYLKVLEISRYGNVIQGLLYPLTPTGGIDGYGLVVNPKWEAADTRYNEATEKVEVVEATPASPSFTPGELAALSFVLTDCITQYADIMDKDAYQPRGSKALLTAYKKIREVV